jgi:hypothetical protein
LRISENRVLRRICEPELIDPEDEDRDGLRNVGPYINRTTSPGWQPERTSSEARRLRVSLRQVF